MNDKTNYRPDIDGLRGIAVLSVIGFHVGIPFVTGGFVGVDIFFLISGYLICSIIHREIRADRFSFARFYQRRVKRILPALFMVLVLCDVVCTLVLTPVELKDFSRSAVAAVVGASNVYFWNSANYFSPAAEFKPLMMTWSLGVEEQFYLAFPILLLCVHRFRAAAALISVFAVAVASLLASSWLTGRSPSAAFFLLPARAWELGAGALLAIHETRLHAGISPVSSRWSNWAAVVGMAMLFVAIFCYDAATPFPGVAAAVPVLGTALLIAAKGSQIHRKALSSRPLVFVGLISYSWYLWHWPLLSIARLVSDRVLSLTTASSVAGVSFILAILSWRLIERPFRNSNANGKSTLRGYGFTALALVSAAGVLIAGRGWPGRLPVDFAAFERSSDNPGDPCLSYYGQTLPDMTPACLTARPGVPTIALIGDSHAAALGSAVRQWAADRGYGYAQLTKSSCPTLKNVSRLMHNHPAHLGECSTFNRTALQVVTDSHEIAVVIVAGYWTAPFAEESSGQRFVREGEDPVSVTPAQSRNNLAVGLRETVTALKAAGKRVVLVKDVPLFDFDPVRSIALTAIPARRALARLLSIAPSGDGESTPTAHRLNRSDVSDGLIDELAAADREVTVLDPGRSLCTADRCAYAETHALYYVDSQHLSAAGARRVMRDFEVSLTGARR